MPRHRFTLAALATLAVPGLDVAVARTFTGGGEGQHDAALLTDRGGEHLVVRAPTGPDAGRRLDAEVHALAALTTGARNRLPFAVPAARGSTSAPHAVVTSYVPGSRLVPVAVRPGSALADSLARAVAAVHSLPSGVVADAGLPVASAADCTRAVTELVARAHATGEVPGPLVDRWSRAAADPVLQRFRPTVVHGSLAAECVLTAPRGTPEERVTGVLGWSSLAVGDPARDLAWTLGLPVPGAAASVLDTYRSLREVDAALPQRALLHAELEIARWLVFGTETGSRVIVDDAVQMLGALLTGVRAETAGSLDPATPRSMTVAEVERMLDARTHSTRAGDVAASASTPAHAARSSAAE